VASLGGELGLEGVGGMQRGDRLHGGVQALGAGLRGVVGRRRNKFAEFAIGLAGESGRKDGKGGHGSGGLVL
jgi:hypothetical protein